MTLKLQPVFLSVSCRKSNKQLKGRARKSMEVMEVLLHLDNKMKKGLQAKGTCTQTHKHKHGNVNNKLG